jgi:hypothetical protein
MIFIFSQTELTIMITKKFILVKTYATKQQAKQAAPRSAAIIKHNDGRFIVKKTKVIK